MVRRRQVEGHQQRVTETELELGEKLQVVVPGIWDRARRIYVPGDRSYNNPLNRRVVHNLSS